MRKILFALAATSMVAPTMIATTPADAKRVYREFRGKDGRLYCSRADGTTGIVVGGVGGALAARTIVGGGDKTLATIVGAGVGALAGREIDRSNTKRRCASRR